MYKLSEKKKILIIMSAMASIFILPYAGAVLRYGAHFPSRRFIYPAVKPLAKAGFHPVIFTVIAVCFGALILFYLFPRLFGFKKAVIPDLPPKMNKKLPSWFYVGLFVLIPSWIILWGKFPGCEPLFKFCDMGLWWGLTLIIDGIVFVRRDGISMIATRPKELIAISLASISGWMIFEYVNFFVDRNWFYPLGDTMPPAEFLCYSILASSAVFPIAFEFYGLFCSFPKLCYKYSNGYKLNPPKQLCWIIIVLCLVSMFFISFYPDRLFFAVWLAPLLLFINLLYVLDIWTPFSLLNKGDWSPLLLLGLSWLASGLCVECWNYFSGTHVNDVLQTKNTLYWAYSVPYVNKYHLFEMPILGYMGYLPYGVYAAIWWLTFAYILGIPTKFTPEHHRNL